MVFQKPNPFPKTIRENIAFGLKVNEMTDNIDDRIEKALTQVVLLWDEVKDDLDKNALELSGGQQQRLCIARTIAVEPDTILMDEPCSALDPVATKRIEDLMQELVQNFSILLLLIICNKLQELQIIVHSSQQKHLMMENVEREN